MKKVIVIKIDVDLPVEERAMLEAKFRKEYKDGLIIFRIIAQVLLQRLMIRRSRNERPVPSSF